MLVEFTAVLSTHVPMMISKKKNRVSSANSDRILTSFPFIFMCAAPQNSWKTSFKERERCEITKFWRCIKAQVVVWASLEEMYSEVYFGTVMFTPTVKRPPQRI